jgi:general secretion pathway protein I
MKRPGNAETRGFTLIEVVVALAIVAIGMLAAFRAVTQTASNAAYLRDRTFAAWIASDLITELRLSGQMPSVDATDGRVEFANQEWRWRRVVVETQVAGLRQVRVQVRRATDPADASLAEVVGVLGEAQLESVASPTPWGGAVAEAP